MESHSQTSLLPLFLVSVLAFIIPIFTSWFSKRYKIPIPTVVGEIICGIIIGNSFLGLIGNTESIPWLDFLSLFGFTYLMFLSGLEVDVNAITNKQQIGRAYASKKFRFKSPLFLGISHFVLTLILASIVSIVLYKNGLISSWVMMTLILSTTSVSIVVPVLKEKSLSKTNLGQTILLSALIADLLTMVLITLFIALSISGKPSFTILFLILIIGLIAVIYRLHLSKTFDGFIRKLFILKPFMEELSHATTQIKVRGAIALMVIFIVSSQAMGFEVILGAFLAGILTTIILGEEKTDKLEMKLDAIGYGFFIPIFFLSVGINLDLTVFFASKSAWILLLFLIVSAFAIKIIPSFIFMLRFKAKEALSSGLLLSSRLSLIIAASTIGLKEGLITEEINAAIVMVAVTSCILSPILFNRVSDESQKSIEGHTIIVGANIIARILTENILEHASNVVLIAINRDEYSLSKRKNLPVILNGNNIEQTLIDNDIANAKVIILTTKNDEFNLSTALFAKNFHNVSNIVALINNINYRDTFKEYGIETVTKTYTLVEKLASKSMFPHSEYHGTLNENEINIVDVLIHNRNFDGKKIKDIQLPENTFVVCVIRDEEYIVPNENTHIHLNDHLTLVGGYDNIQKSINLLS